MQGGQMGKAGQQMGQQLSQMEQLQQLLQQAQAAANQCKGACQGNSMLQQWKQGGGMGKWGQGAGGNAPMLRTPTGTKMTKADAPVGQGEIIAKQLVEGNPFTGESKAKMKEVASVVDKGYDEALAAYWQAVKLNLLLISMRWAIHKYRWTGIPELSN